MRTKSANDVQDVVWIGTKTRIKVDDNVEASGPETASNKPATVPAVPDIAASPKPGQVIPQPRPKKKSQKQMDWLTKANGGNPTDYRSGNLKNRVRSEMVKGSQSSSSFPSPKTRVVKRKERSEEVDTSGGSNDHRGPKEEENFSSNFGVTQYLSLNQSRFEYNQDTCGKASQLSSHSSLNQSRFEYTHDTGGDIGRVELSSDIACSTGDLGT